MISRTNLAAAALGLLLIILPTTSQAATAQVRSKVYGILTGDKYSGCMVQIGRIPDDSGLNCPVRDRTWVPLGCQGNWGARSDADRNLRIAQMAILTGDKITVTITDSKKASGWCFGSQVILFR